MARSSLSRVLPFPRPPTEDELPSDDGEPMETEQHRRQMVLSIETLELAWADRKDVYVGGNMGLYFSETQAKKNDFRAPDVFVVLDTVRRKRKSWVVWQENGRTPNVIIELLSESTEAQDRGTKMRIYARVLRVPEYYLFHPITGVLEGYSLDARTMTYRPMKAFSNGDLACHQLGLRLGVRAGSVAGVPGKWLRWLDAKSLKPLPSAEEKARLAEHKAHSAEAKARLAARKAHSAEEKARLAEHKAHSVQGEVELLRKQLAAYEAKPPSKPSRTSGSKKKTLLARLGCPAKPAGNRVG